jgi:signal transduction histidine kinase
MATLYRLVILGTGFSWLAISLSLAQPVLMPLADQPIQPLDTRIDYARIGQTNTLSVLNGLSVRQQVDTLIRLGQFAKPGPQGLHFGAANENFLFRFRLRRTADDPPTLWLTMANPGFADAICFVEAANRQVTARRTTVWQGTGQQYLLGHLAAWPIALPDTSTVTVYLFCAGGDVPKHYPLALATADGLQALLTRYGLFWGGYFGLMIALFLYNLVLYGSVSDRNYLFYCLLLLSHALFQLKNSGYGLRFIWWDWPMFGAHAPVLIGGVSFFAGLAFSIVFLDTRRYAPRLYPVMVMVAGQYLVMSPLVVLTHIIGDSRGLVWPENYWIMAYFVLSLAGSLAVRRWGRVRLAGWQPFARVLVWLSLNGLVLTTLGEVLGPFSIMGIVSAVAALVLCVWAGVAALRAGNANARFYLAAWSSVLIALAIYVVYLTGIWPYRFWLANAMAFGTAGESLLFALALANRINLARRDRERALTDLVQQLTVNQQQEQRLQNIRNDIARDLHDDIGSSLSSIGILTRQAGQLTKHEPARAQLLLDRIGLTTQTVMDNMSDLVWSVNPAHDTPAQVLNRMRDFGTECFADTGTTFVFTADNAGSLLMDLAERRRHLFLIYKEALVNCARYAGATRVTASLTQTGPALTLRVTDNGCGFDPATAHTRNPLGGNGLKNMQTRAGLMGGQLQITTEPGRGTTILLTMLTD